MEHVLGLCTDSIKVSGPASQPRRFPLIRTTVKVMWWEFLLPVPAKLALLALTFCQPILVNRVLVFLQEKENINIGYGLIGAYALVYIGLAVSGNRVFCYLATRN